MSLIALCYPTLNEADFEWIEAIRETCDKNYEMTEPHFTLIFPVDNIPRDKLIEHAHSIVHDTFQIFLTMRCAINNFSAVDEKSYLFLVPDEGFSRIVRLHDRLYTGILEDELRHDIPFIPHMTIGRFDDPALCKTTADRLNREKFEIDGVISSIDIASYDYSKIVTIESIKLSEY